MSGFELNSFNELNNNTIIIENYAVFNEISNEFNGILNFCGKVKNNKNIEFHQYYCFIKQEIFKKVIKLGNKLYRLFTKYNKNIEEVIYRAIERVDENDYIFVTVSWENQIMQDFDEFENKLIDEIDNIACSKGWNGLRDKNVFRKAIRKINDFYSLLSAIARNSNEKKWLEAHNDEEIYVRLRRIFASKRDKDDTDKAIYRMCCIGLVEDVTIDYFSILNISFFRYIFLIFCLVLY